MHTLAAECTNNKNVSEAEYSLAARHGHAMPYKLGQTRVVGDRAVFYIALEANEELASRTRYSTERARFCRFACVSIACVLCLCYFGLPPDLCDMDLQQMSSSPLTNNDILVSLLNVPFSRRSDIERNEILKRGRPTPKLSILKKYKDRSRSFQSSWYDQHKWLCGNGEKSKLFCWPCLLLSTKKTVWSAEGFDDLKNLSRALVRHASSKDHLHAHLSLNNLSNQVFKISELLNEHSRLQKIKYNEEVKKNREVFKILVDVTSLICKQELAFRGHDESEDSLNRGNFKAIFNLVISRNPELKQHWDNMGFFRGLSKTIQNELIECFQDELIKVIESDINLAPFFACMVDETTDISEKTQFSIVVRLVDSNGEIQEYFLGFYGVNEDRTADGLCNVLCKALEKFNIKHKLVAQTYDGCSVMSGELNGLQAKVREIAPQAIFTHCFAHRLNLVLQQSCSKIKPVKVFFSTLQGMPAYFHRSSKRTAVLDRVLGKRVPTNSEVRWNSNSKIISAVHTNRLTLIEVFRELLESSDAVTVREAQGYLNNLEDFSFVFLLSVFQKIFEKTDLLFKTLQKISNDTQFCNNSVVECISYMRKLRDDKKYDEFIQLTESATGSRSSVMKRHQFVNKDVASSNYYKQIYFEVLDNIITQLEVRFSRCDELTFLKLGETKNFAQYDKEFPSDALTSLINTYGEHFNKEKLRTELETIFSFKHKDKFHSLRLNKLIKQMTNDDTKEILPEAFKLFTLIATIPASSSSVERSFSCLKRIKSYLRNTMTQDRLSALALVSVEKETLQKLERRPSWYDDVIDCFAKKKERRVNLLYK